ncbi:polymorphic toxin type 50 domain-containing protein [uncultured Selenomonas sp.]|uniref:polymorphic toxin type 50 domain-containing protein n=1 Tax=uncultured Selenomonas sp. TaxID=159275 RepID=UPI0028D416D0|nr:polymorphic toxin type 50 domain-containing protein [uncultured Selenomonas sp.]
MRQTAPRAEIDAFERRIRELIAEGYAVPFAVRQAYREYPVMRVLFGELIDQIRAEAERGYGEALPQGITDRLFTHSWAPDGLTLSERTTRGAILVRELVARTISEQIKKSATYRQASLAIFDGYQEAGIIPTQSLPKFLQDLTQVARRAGVSRGQILAALKPIRRQIAKGTTAGMRAAYSQLVNALEDQNEKALDKAIYAATQERTRYFADRIARTEMARAYQDGFLLQWDNNDDCVAYQWKLSGRHPRYDICDLYAKANLYGMGAGVFPKDKVPRLPAHPHCMCFLKPVIRGMLDNETPRERIEEGGREYLDSVDLHHRQMILGIHGEKDVRGGVSWTAKARGYSGAKLQGRFENIPKSLKPFIHDGKINIEDIAKRQPGESVEVHERRVWDFIRSPFCTKEFTTRQEIHIKGSKLYQEGKSYYTDDALISAERICTELQSGHADIRFTKVGNWTKKVKIYHPDIGCWLVSPTGGKTEVHCSMVHFSNRGLHTVPTNERRETN